MKKLKNILLLVIILVIFAGCSSSSSNSLKDISYSKFKNMLDNKESFFFIVVKDGCSYCEAFVPKVEEVLNEYDIGGYKLNLTEMSYDEYTEFMNNYNVDGTPTTIFITEGKEVSLLQRMEGNVSKEKFISKLEANNYIKK